MHGPRGVHRGCQNHPHDDGQYVRDAENAGLDDIAGFFREVMEQDSARAKRCHEFLGRLQGTDRGGPATQ